MEHDRDEWRRPWRREQQRPAAVEPHGEMPFVNDAPAEPATTRERRAAGEADRPVAGTDTAVIDRQDIAGAARPFPQPPPAEWDADDEGPGSPAGSVRPPDTTGTVDAPPSATPAASRRGRGMVTGMAGALIGAVIGTAGTLAVVRTTPAFQPGARVQAPVVQTQGGGNATAVVPAVAQAVTPSVVRIDVLTAVGAGGGAPRAVGLGSGVIYRSDGYVITNNHVIEAADEVRVRLANGDLLEAEVVGTDALNDLAVLKVDRVGLPAVNIREEAELIVGETAIAIGSPFGLDASVTAGVVSAVNRDIQVPDEEGATVIPAVVQTDAAINPGNSGGALVDARGELIGINTAILSGSGGSQGVGFAIPASQAVASAEELIERGFVRHPFLGISGVDLSPEVAARFDLEVEGGAVVDSVQEGSAAADAGLQEGDILTALEGEALDSMSDLVVTLRRYAPGDTVTLDVVRDGEQLRLDVVLGERPR